VVRRYRVSARNSGPFNIRQGVELHTAVVRTLQVGEVVEVLGDRSLTNSGGDVRVQLADRTGWCTLRFRTGDMLLDLVG
jgi:hypothetical protein